MKSGKLRKANRKQRKARSFLAKVYDRAMLRYVKKLGYPQLMKRTLEAPEQRRDEGSTVVFRRFI